MALRGGPVQHVLVFKQADNARWELLNWLEGQGLEGVADTPIPQRSLRRRMCEALAAWKWSVGQPAWVERAAPPIHPFDFAC